MFCAMPMKNVQVISLPEAAARRAAISGNLGGRGVDFEFFDAVDGLAEADRYRDSVDSVISEKILGRKMTPGEVGCALSHAFLLRKFIEQSALPYLFVFEDDIRLHESAIGAMAALSNRHREIHHLIVFPSGYDFFPRWRSRIALGAAQRLYQSVDPAWGTYAMFITRHVAERLLEDFIPVVVPADFVGRVYGRNRLPVYGVWPPVLHHPHFEQFPAQSSIGAERARAQAASDAPGFSRSGATLGERLKTFLRQCL
jgi:glycosyl transferase family 25